jgi:hypothetical protein
VRRNPSVLNSRQVGHLLLPSRDVVSVELTKVRVPAGTSHHLHQFHRRTDVLREAFRPRQSRCPSSTIADIENNVTIAVGRVVFVRIIVTLNADTRDESVILRGDGRHRLCFGNQVGHSSADSI